MDASQEVAVMDGSWARRVATRCATATATFPYRLAWAAVAVSTGLMAVVGELLAPEPSVVPSVFGIMLLGATMCACPVALERGVRVRSTVGPCVAVSTWTAAQYSLWIAAPGWSVALLVLLPLTAPRVVRLAATIFIRLPLPPSSPAASWSSDVHEVPWMSTRGLCELWTATSAELRSELSARRRLAVLTVREACLDELWERDEVGCLRWWQAGAACSDPSPYIGRGAR